MPLGELVTFSEGEIEGFIDHITYVESRMLNGGRGMSYPFSIDRPSESTLLVINLQRYSPMPPKWRIWINDFSLTREFKPTWENNLGERVLSSIIYDVSPIVKEGRNEVTISSLGGNVSLLEVSLVSVFREHGFYTRYNLRAGGVQLRPGEEYMIKAKGSGYVIVRSDCRSKVRAYQGITSTEFTLDPGEANELEIPRTEEFRLVHLGEGKQGTVIIPLLYWMEVNEPELSMELQTTRSIDGLKIHLINGSEFPLDKVILNVMHNGVTITYKVLRNVTANSSSSLVIPLKKEMQGQITVRAVGVKGSYRKVLTKSI
jgi:hypothetical protein